MRRILVLGLAALAGGCFAQDKLTLDEALQMARKRNGDIRAAEAQVAGAEAQVRVAKSAFLPNLSANGEWSASSARTYTGAFATAGRTNSTGTALGIDASFRLLDNGSRGNNLRGAEADARSTAASSQQTLRTTLFSVVNQFFDTLRAQELIRVYQAQEERARKQYDFTVQREKEGAGARKDILQAEADYLNAQTTTLIGGNTLTNNAASLRASIGWDQAADLPPLDNELVAGPVRGDLDLVALTDFALKRRPDLIAARERVRSADASLANARLNRGVLWSIDLRGNRSFARNVSDSAALVLSATVPIFDGFSTRSLVEAQEANRLALLESLKQQERTVRAEVEAAVKIHTQNRLVLRSSELALRAARQNYDVAVRAQEFGKFNILEIQSAQVSLATAESNFITATYDTLISDIRLSLVLGEALPGEGTQP